MRMYVYTLLGGLIAICGIIALFLYSQYNKDTTEVSISTDASTTTSEKTYEEKGSDTMFGISPEDLSVIPDEAEPYREPMPMQ